MNNDDFRQMLSTLPKGRQAPAASQQKRNKPAAKPGNFHHRKKKDEDDKTEYEKIYDESQQNLQEIMKGYRDRALERRKVDTGKEADEAALRLMIHGIMPTSDKNRDLTIEQSKLLGGDLEHTHMVKGLDYTLLEKMKTDRVSSDESEDDADKDLPASQIAPEKIAKNPMVRRMMRMQFHTVFPKRNEHFQPGRMAYICDFEDESTDVPSTLMRSLDITPKENPQVKNDRLILEHLTNILPYLRDKKRKKKKKDEQTAPVDDGTKIFEDAGEYDTKVKPLQLDKHKRDDRRDERHGREKKSYFDDKRDKKDRDDHKRDDVRRGDDKRDRDRRRRSPEREHRRRDRSRSPSDRRSGRSSESSSTKREKPMSALSEAIANESRKRASSPVAPAKSVSSKKKLMQTEAYGEYYTEDMDFVETIASDDDDDEALAMAKERMRHELGTDGKAKGASKKFDKKRVNPSKADVTRKLDNELKKIDEVWNHKKGGKKPSDD